MNKLSTLLITTVYATAVISGCKNTKKHTTHESIVTSNTAASDRVSGTHAHNIIWDEEDRK